MGRLKGSRRAMTPQEFVRIRAALKEAEAARRFLGQASERHDQAIRMLWVELESWPVARRVDWRLEEGA